MPNGRGFVDLDEARKKFGDPSIQAGLATTGRGSGLAATDEPTSLEKFRAAGRFLEGTGQAQTLDTTPVKAAGLVPDGEEEIRPSGPKGVPSGPLTVREGVRGAKSPGGGFISFSPTKGRGGGPSVNFGLPTDRLPTFNELGGAIGQMFKFVSELSKFNRARGLVPGTPIQKQSPTAEAALEKARLSAALKEHETAILSGNTERAAELQKIIDEELKIGKTGGIGGIEDTEALDLEAIKNF